MNSTSSRKYKDELPRNTINRIRNILNDLGVFTVETNWKNSADGFFSVTVLIVNTNLSTNGKGTTYEYALASAYAELMERLQNQAQFRLSIDFSQELLEYKGFYYTPDEKNMNIEEILNRNDDWIKKQMSKVNANSEKNDLLQKWKAMSSEDTPSDFITLPYFNISNNRLSYIPIKMISKMYMSNGMCAGNTIEEALVQGLSEILERVVNKEIIKKRISPPTIPNYYFKKYPRIDAMITKIKSIGNYDVIVKDCSLNKGYPVIGVIFIDKNNQTYFVKFGAHPIFEIAVERTLTELLQGQNISNMMGVKEFSYRYDIEDEFKNIIGILVNGSGHYPSEIFSQKFSYEFKGFEDLREATNKEMLTYIINLIESEGYDIFIRDVSYLGFPSYHIIVPGLSEVEEFDDIRELDEYIEYIKIKRYVRNLDNLSEKQVEEVIKYFNNIDYNSESSIVQFLNLPIKNIFPWYYVKTDLFIAALNYKLGNLEATYKSFDKFVKYFQNKPYNKLEVTYYKCARDYIGALMDNLKEKDIIDMLINFYPSNMVRGVMSDLGDSEQVLKKYGQIKCFNCKECKLKDHCSYDSVEKVYKTLKERYAINVIDQNNLKALGI